MAIRKRTSSTKNPPILSHEFVIQNHADIVSCFAMVFVVGLLFQVTAPMAAPFVVMGHNTTDLFSGTPDKPVLYSSGMQDLALVFFYSQICIVIHAVIQEYVLDKLSRKLHLSKTKHSKFNESGQLLVFTAISAVWSFEVLRRDGTFTNLSNIWVGYPHIGMTYLTKFFFIIQFSYWVHSFPELYFQRVKREEMASRITYATLNLVFLVAGYLTNFTRLSVALSLIHFSVECLFHVARLAYFSEKDSATHPSQMTAALFKVWNLLFVIARLAIAVSTIFTFWVGLAGLDNKDTLDIKGDNFNTPLIRIYGMSGILLLQLWMLSSFISFQLKRRREREAEKALKKKKPVKPFSDKKKSRSGEGEEKLNELPEVDQDTKITQRKKTK